MDYELSQSSSSKKKMLSTFSLKTCAIFSDNRVEGTNLPFSIELIVCRDTPTFSARSAWVRFIFALSTLMVFFIKGSFLELEILEPANRNEQGNGKALEGRNRKPGLSLDRIAFEIFEIIDPHGNECCNGNGCGQGFEF